MAEQVTIYWVDMHSGLRPPTLESAEGTMTAKQIRHPARWGHGYSITEVDKACFTPQEAIAKRRAHVEQDLRSAEYQVGQAKANLAVLDELEKGLLT